MSRLEELGVFMDGDNAAAVVAATLEWITKSNDGKEYFVRLFGFDWEGGRSDEHYYLMDKGTRVNGDDIYFLKTAVVKGQFIPPSMIDSQRVDKTGCDECGILGHCTREVRDQKGNLTNVCNSCLAQSDLSAWRDKSGGLKECESCTVELCKYNPRRNNVHRLAV